MRAANYCDTLDVRKALLDSFGGLPDTVVQNNEWLYMLEEDTRNSLAIEGFFASEEELKATLTRRKGAPEILNYFRTAQTIYDTALQYYRDLEIRLDVPTVRHIHSELFRELDSRRGEFRKGGIQIQGARVQPPEFDIEAYVRCALQLSLLYAQSLPMLPALARAHTLFEGIHPFHDGNGRVGRIVLNYLAISKGYPPIVIKGLTAAERKRYYSSLEEADVGFHAGFPEPRLEALQDHLEQGQFASLEALLCEGLSPRVDTLIGIAFEAHEPLVELRVLAAAEGVSEAALRQRVHRGTLVAVKRGKKLYSHPRLALPDARKRQAV